MYGQQNKIRHVNGAGEVRYFTPAVASNKSAMKNGGWFPQEEARGQNTQSTSSIANNAVAFDYKKELEEKDEVIASLRIELTAAHDLVGTLHKELEEVKTELAASKSLGKSSKTKQKDNE